MSDEIDKSARTSTRQVISNDLIEAFFNFKMPQSKPPVPTPDQKVKPAMIESDDEAEKEVHRRKSRKTLVFSGTNYVHKYQKELNLNLTAVRNSFNHVL
jgi:hypothetical protein